MALVRTLFSFLSFLVSLYSTLIVIRVILSWVCLFSRKNNYYSQITIIDTLDQTLGKITDPYLNLFTRVTSLRRSGIDFTPVLALVFLNVAKSIFSIISHTGRITIFFVIALIISALWSVISFVMVTMLIMLVVRFFVGRSNSYQSSKIIDFLDPILNTPVLKVYNLFYKKKGNVSDQKLVTSSLIFYFIIYIILSSLKSALVLLLMGL